MATSADSRLAVPPFLEDDRAHRKLMTLWMQQVHLGHIANIGTVTLLASTTSTTVADSRVGPNSFIWFMPTTLNAESEMSNGISVRTRGKQQFVITHKSNAATDKTFVYCILG